MNGDTKIPVSSLSPLRRSASVRVRGERANLSSSLPKPPFPVIGEKEEVSLCHLRTRKLHSRVKLLRSTSQASGLNKDDDLDSVTSFGSGMTNMSSASTCEHACFAKNGTTFSGRNMKYIVHCPTHSTEPDEYLTPTQRANKKIKQLKSLLQLAKEKLLEKEREIFKLTKEVVELRLFKASLKTSPNLSDVNSPVENKDINKSFIGTIELNSTTNDKEFAYDTLNDLSPIKTLYGEVTDHTEKLSYTPDYLLSSLADSGHYDDLASSLSLQSKDSLGCSDKTRPNSSEPRLKNEDIKLMYENKIEERRLVYQEELAHIMKKKEDENLEMLNNFEMKILEEQKKYEEKLKVLIEITEGEKLEIVNNFEKKLEEAKLRYLRQSGNTNEKGLQTESFYTDIIDAEKQIYEAAIREMKENFELEKARIEKMYDESMYKERCKFEDVVQEIQARSDEKVKELLEKIVILEKQYAEIEPQYQEAKKKISDLETENERINKLLEEQEEKQKNMYLRMYMKGQEAARLEHAEQVASAAENTPDRVSVPELLVQLQITETELDNLKDEDYRSKQSQSGICLLSAKEAVSLWMLAARKAMYRRLAETQQSSSMKAKQKSDSDPEATLQFLKSAVYYFLTDNDNQLEHLRAIESILGYTAAEKEHIEKSCLV